MARIGLTLLAAASLLVQTGTAAASPRSIRKMDPVAIQAVPEQKLCSAYAHYVGLNKSYASITDEIRRRGLKCTEALEQVVSNCSMLQIVSVQPVGPGAVAYTVRNTSPKLKAFRIYQAGILSSRFTLAPSETRGFGVQADPRIAQLSGIRSRLSGDTRAELTECLTTTWR